MKAKSSRDTRHKRKVFILRTFFPHSSQFLSLIFTLTAYIHLVIFNPPPHHAHMRNVFVFFYIYILLLLCLPCIIMNLKKQKKNERKIFGFCFCCYSFLLHHHHIGVYTRIIHNSFFFLIALRQRLLIVERGKKWRFKVILLMCFFFLCAV